MCLLVVLMALRSGSFHGNPQYHPHSGMDEDSYSFHHIQPMHSQLGLLIEAMWKRQFLLLGHEWNTSPSLSLSLDLPEHLKSTSFNSETPWPLKWLGEWQRVYGANRDEFWRYRESHDRWQSQVNGLSDNRSARILGIPLNISRGKVVILLLFNVLQKQQTNKEEAFRFNRIDNEINRRTLCRRTKIVKLSHIHRLIMHSSQIHLQYL